MKLVTLLIPCHNEQENLAALHKAVAAVADAEAAYRWQFLLIDDGSTDGTLDAMKDLRRRDGRVAWLSFSRNFGKEAALLAGFDHADGDCVVVMDADLQHPPSVIPQMLRLWEQGYDDVYAKREDRGRESVLRRKLSMAYYKLLQHMADIDILPNVGDFRLLDRRCVLALRKLRETERYTKGLYCWIGFRKKELPFRQGSRERGHSSFGYRKLFNLAIQGITSYTTVPLRLATIMGFTVSLLAIVYSAYVFFKTIIVGEPVHGFPTLLISMLLIGGIQLICLGIIGEYLARIFVETKRRPPYLIGDSDLGTSSRD